MNKTTSGWMNGFLGVVIFSGSLPATRLAVLDFDPLFLTVCRAAIAGVLAGGLLLIFRQQRPLRSEVIPLLLVALCVVVGFPLLSALALQHITSAHFYYLPWTSSAFHSDIRRTAGGRTTTAGFLGYVNYRKLPCSGIRPNARGRVFTAR